MNHTIPSFFIGSIRVEGKAILSPMAGYSDSPYRSIARAMGSAMSYTEFVPARGLLQERSALLHKISFTADERPVSIQIFGAREVDLVAAARQIAALEPDIIDLNLGCSSPNVADHGAGAGLLCDPTKIGAMVRALTRAVSIPVTAKIRLGWDDSSRNAREVAKILEDAGAAMIAVHGRTKMQAYRGTADWDAIGEVRQAVSIPVLGNGDVRCAADVDRLRAHAGVPAVLIGRAALGHPWIFQERDRAEVTQQERYDTMRQHLALSIEHHGEALGIRMFQRHAPHYVYGIPGASQQRAALSRATTREEMMDGLETLKHPKGLQDL